MTAARATTADTAGAIAIAAATNGAVTVVDTATNTAAMAGRGVKLLARFRLPRRYRPD